MERKNMDMGEPILVIMAGGHGERLWPYSRRNHPKQLLEIIGHQSLLQRTSNLIAELTNPERIFISTNTGYRTAVQNHLPLFNPQNILCEPESRNTAAGIGLAATYINHYLPEEDPVLGFIPCDLLIQDPPEMRRVLKAGFEFAGKTNTGVIYGMIPTRLETGFGYIQPGELLDVQNNLAFHQVKLFKEKPNQLTLEQFIGRGAACAGAQFLWNGGILLWKLSYLMEEIANHLPQIAAGLKEFKSFIGTPEETERLQQIYTTFPSISIDYGVLEKTNHLVVVPSHYGWEDLGNWSAVERLLPKDTSENSAQGAYLALDTKNCFFYSPHKIITALGVSDLIVIETEDVLMICAKERVQDIKQLVEKLPQKNWGHLL
jgi:mannose-1-phosphate guanylyltransferase